MSLFCAMIAQINAAKAVAPDLDSKIDCSQKGWCHMTNNTTDRVLARKRARVLSEQEMLSVPGGEVQFTSIETNYQGYTDYYDDVKE